MKSELQKMQDVLDTNSGKYLLAYEVKDNEEIRRGLPVFKDKRIAEQKANDLVKDIDIVISCWVEEKS